MRRAVLLLLLAALAPSCHDDATAAAPKKKAGGRSTRSTADLLAQLAMLAGAPASGPALAEWAARIDGGKATLDDYLDEILDNPRFGREILPALLFGAYGSVKNYYAFPSAFVLKTSDPDAKGTVVRYLRKPCAASEAVRVTPWWDPGGEVLVCPDAYRPEKWTIPPEEQRYKSTMTLTCDSQVGSPELETQPLCGCGPNLIRCLRDAEMYDAMNASAMREVKETVAWVVEHDLPIASVFTANESFRDRNMEYYYRRQQVGAEQRKDALAALKGLKEWPEKGRWAPRQELKAGQHAGVLTAPQILHWLPDRRQRQRGYYEILWCANRSSFGATTEKILEISDTANLAFVHDSWKRLAHTPICTECHARLDYGFQFFMGYPDSRASTHFVPELQPKGKGPLYARDIDDERGSDRLTPRAFAELATSQPEFRDCLTGKLLSYVLADNATAEDRETIEKAVAKSGRFKPAAKAALRLYAARWGVAPGATGLPPAPGDGAGTPPREGWVTVPAPLRAQLDEHCIDCHGKEPWSEAGHMARPFDLGGAELPRPLVIRMADHVAHGQMPRPPRMMARADREALVKALVAALFPDPAAREEAEVYYLGMVQGLPAQLLDNTLHTIDGLAPDGTSPGAPWGALERSLWPDQMRVTPGFVATSALEALRACRGKGARAFANCLKKGLSGASLARGAP